jgi:hypothetical protein
MGRLNDRATKPPDALAKKSLPDNVTDQVPETKTYLFIKLPDLILLIDPDSQATEIARSSRSSSASVASTRSTRATCAEICE